MWTEIFYPKHKERDNIPCPHFNISIVTRSEGQSAVRASAYLSGSKLYCQSEQRHRDYSYKEEVVYTEVLLPTDAPPEFSDRQTLWNSVEAAEKRCDSQLARRIILALPKELSQEDNIRLLKQYCQEQFVSKGMCCDFALHDKGDGNPHAHILLTMRGLDKNGKWMPKSKSEYVLDENGERIRQKNGRWKMQKVNTVDWNDRDKAELWRHEWELLQNSYLEKAGVPERVNMKSFERQGITDFAPTVHMGAAATVLERKGIQTTLGNLNRRIQAFNRMMQSMKDRIAWLIGQAEKLKDVLAELSEEKPPTLAQLLTESYEQRSEERKDFNVTSFHRFHLSVDDWNRMQDAKWFLQKNGIETPQQLKEHLERLAQNAENIHHNHDVRIKLIQQADTTCDYLERKPELDPIFEKYSKNPFKTAKKKYYEKHKAEIERYKIAHQFMENHPQLKDRVSIAVQRGKWQKENNGTDERVEPLEDEVYRCKEIVRWLNAVLPKEERITYRSPVKDKSMKLLPEITVQKKEKDSVQKKLSRKKQDEKRDHARQQEVTEKNNNDLKNHRKKPKEQDL